MFGNRRVPPRIVFALSLLLAVICLAVAWRYGCVENWLPTALWGGVGVWFALDALRAYGWTRQSSRTAQLPEDPQKRP